MLKLSRAVYGKTVDDKAWRAGIDIVGARMAQRTNLSYDPKTKTWSQSGRETKIQFRVRSQPTTYRRTDTIKTHVYPVTFLIRKFDMGLDSAFRWRTGSFKKPLFGKKGDSSKMRERTANQNIKNQVQLDFFFTLEWVLKRYDLLWGPCRATRPPNIKNKSYTPFLDKHAYYCLTRGLIRILSTKKGAALNKKI